MLPFDKLNPTDRVIIDSLKTQNDSLREQSKILHTISDEIFKNRRSSSNKENKDIQREVFKLGSGISEIKSYLAGKGKGAASTFGNKTQPDKGFFTNLFSKVFGPSRYQQKMMDDMSALRDVTERQARSIEFIARQNSDSKRAIEREKLAEAIVRRMAYLDIGGGGASGGMLAGLGKVLLAGIVGAIAVLSKTLMTAFNALFDGLKKLIEAFGKFRLPPIGGLPGGGMPGGGGGGRDGRSGPPGIPIPPDNDKRPSKPYPMTPRGGKGLPVDPNRRLEGPKTPEAGRQGFRFPWNEGKYGPQVEDAKGVRSSGASRFSPSGFRAALIAALVSIGVLSMSQVQENGEDIEEIVRKGLPDPKRRNRKLAPGESLDVIREMGGKAPFQLQDPNVGDMITAEQYKRRYKDTLTEGQQKKLDEFIQKEKDAEDERQRLILEYNERENQSEFNKLLEEATRALDNFSDNLDFLSKDRLKETIVPFLDQLGEISIQGQKINLAPGLGTALAKTMEDTAQMGEDLADYMKEKLTSPTIITNNNVIDNSNKGGGGGTTFVPPKPTHEGSRTLDEFFFGRKIK